MVEEREQGIHIYTISYELLFQDQFETLLNFCCTRVQRLDAVSPTTPRPAGRRCHPASIHTLPRCLVPAGGKCITWGFLIHSDPHLVKDGYISLNNVTHCTPLTLVWLEL